MEHPGVGVALYLRRDGKVLLGKRKGGHGAGTWCAPGGKLEMNESPEDCARRETKEETGLRVGGVRFIGITNDIWPDIGTHFVTVSFVADLEAGDAVLTEPDKFEEWQWFDWRELPEPLFLSTRNFNDLDINPLEF